MGAKASAGVHLIVDGYVNDPGTFTRATIEEMFSKVISALEMKALDKPQVYEVPVDPTVLERVKRTGKFEDEGGITAVVVISTSHLSIHCWPLQRFFSLDAFSCKDFDSDLAYSIVRETLGVSRANVTVLQRHRPL
jgi:S-adenosylmethionine decarboxylase